MAEDITWDAPTSPTPQPVKAQEDITWDAKPAEPEEKKQLGPMPGIGEAIYQGGKKGLRGVVQTGEAVTGEKSDLLKEPESPAGQPLEWGDALDPTGKLLPKLGYRLGEGAPTLAGGVAGGIAGSVAGPVGGVVGGAAGAGIGAAVQTLGPVFANELQKDPKDPEGAWTRAMEHATTSGIFSSLGWAAFPLKIAQGPIKNILFQALGVQPGLAVTQKGIENVAIDNRPVTEGMLQAGAEGSVMTAVPALGQRIVSKATSKVAPLFEPKPPGPTRSEQAFGHADSIDALVAGGHLTAEQAKGLNDLSYEFRDKALDIRDANIAAGKKAISPEVSQLINYADDIDNAVTSGAATDPHRASLMEAADTLRSDAAKMQFQERAPPVQPLPQKGILTSIASRWVKNVQPELFSPEALKAEPLFAEKAAKNASWADPIVKEGDKYYGKWNGVPLDDQYAFIKAFEGGTAVPPGLVSKYPWMRQREKYYRTALEQAYKDEVAHRSQADYIDNYFPHIWKDPENARQFIQSQSISLGPDWFQKKRYHQLIEDGLNAGLELKAPNVEELITKRLLSSVDMRQKVELLDNLKERGLASEAEHAPSDIATPSRANRQPWQNVKAPNGENWVLAPDVQALWKNAVDSKGLWADQTGLGAGFRGWMEVKNAWVPIKLMLSAFHPLHVMGIGFSDNLARATTEAFSKGEQGVGARLAAYPKAVGRIAQDIAGLPVNIAEAVINNFLLKPFGQSIQVPHLGKTLRAAWQKLPQDRTPEEHALVQRMTEGGFVPQLSEQLKIGAKRKLSDAIRDQDLLKGAWQLPRRLIESIQAPIFEQWIPQLKAAAYDRETRLAVTRHPELLNDDVARKTVFRAIGKQVDNRFGEMFYGGLFWNRTMKDAAIGSFLSLGWNLGFVREFAGGALEPGARLLGDPNVTPTRRLIRDTTSKTTNMLLYAMTAAIANGIVTKANTGDMPEGMDYIFPRIGGNNPDGSPRRTTNMWYTREVPMVKKNIQDTGGVVGGIAQTLYHKMMIAPVVEMATNKDYFGSPLYDPNAEPVTKAWQFAKHVLGNEFNPMSVTGAKKALQLSGKPYGAMDVLKNLGDKDVYMPLLGFGPAPAYASRTDTQNRIYRLYGEHAAKKGQGFDEAEINNKKREARQNYLLALQRKDPEAIRTSTKQMVDLGMKPASIKKLQPGTGDIALYKQLSPDDQKDVLRNAPPEEFVRYFIASKKKEVIANKEFLDMWKAYRIRIRKTPPEQVAGVGQ